MGNVSKTMAYLKRNGIKNTCYEVRERLDKKHIEEIQKRVRTYRGSRYYQEKTSKQQMLMLTDGAFFRKDYLFSILVPAYETNRRYLREMIDSVIAQSAFARVELIVADASQSNQVGDVVKEYMRHLQEENSAKKAEEQYETVIKYIRLKENGGISENTNEALRVAEGDYIGLLDHDDTLAYDALFHVRKKLEESDYAFLYSDEDKGDEDLSHFFEPNVKPDFNFDYLLTNNYICHFLVMKAELMKKLQFRKEYDGAQDFDLVLRAAGELLKEKQKAGEVGHIPKVLYHWRCHESSTAANPESKLYAYEAGKRAVKDFLKVYFSMDEDEVAVEHTAHMGFYRITYRKGLFQARHEVAAVCGRVIRKNRVVDGPDWNTGGEKLKLFAGLKAGYSGYMHRAALSFEVDAMPEAAVCWSPKYQELFKKMEQQGRRLSFAQKQQMAREQGDIFIYLPDFLRQERKEALSDK